jgi:hypothetical protein
MSKPLAQATHTPPGILRLGNTAYNLNAIVRANVAGRDTAGSLVVGVTFNTGRVEALRGSDAEAVWKAFTGEDAPDPTTESAALPAKLAG